MSEQTPAQQAETLEDAIWGLIDTVKRHERQRPNTSELTAAIRTVKAAALRAALPVKQCSNGCAPHESCPQSRAAVSTQAQAASANVSAATRIGSVVAEGVTAGETALRHAFISGLRCRPNSIDPVSRWEFPEDRWTHRYECDAFNAYKARAAVSGEGTTCATCVYAKNYRDVTDEWRTICERTKLDVTDTPEGFGCNFHQPAAPQEDSHAD